MIRINLLPYRDEKRKQLIQTQLVIAGLGLIPAVLVILILLFSINAKITNINAETAKIQADINKQKVSLDEIKIFKKEKETLKNKMAVIEKLKKGKFGPVHIIDHLAINLPGRIWLTKISQKGMVLSMDGKALDNISISDYMINLGKSEYFKSVNLNKIKTDTKTGPKGVQLKSFSLSSSITYTPGIEEPKIESKKKKKKKK